jgi:hypothetical protein
LSKLFCRDPPVIVILLVGTPTTPSAAQETQDLGTTLAFHIQCIRLDAASLGDQWTIPVGGGVGRVFKIGKQHVNLKLAACYNVDAPEGNDDVFNLQFSWTFLFPEG